MVNHFSRPANATKKCSRQFRVNTLVWGYSNVPKKAAIVGTLYGPIPFVRTKRGTKEKTRQQTNQIGAK